MCAPPPPLPPPLPSSPPSHVDVDACRGQKRASDLLGLDDGDYQLPSVAARN